MTAPEGGISIGARRGDRPRGGGARGKADMHIHSLYSDGTAPVRDILAHVEDHTDLDVVANAECNIGIKAIYAAAVKSSVADLARQYRLKPGESDRIADELAAGLVDPLTDAMLCAGIKAGGRDSCYGDSGGPLLATEAGRPVQIGIVSWGEGPSDSEVKCGHADVYGVYSRIDNFRDWIDSHIHGATP